MTYLEELQRYLTDRGVRWFPAREVCRVGSVRKSAILGEAPRRLWPNAVRTLRILDRLRDDLDNPVLVSEAGGWRSELYNFASGGSPDSLHKQFAAFDITSPGIEPRRIALWLHRQDETDDLGLGLYRDFVHVDCRGMLGRTAPARWSEDPRYPRWWEGGG